MTHLDDLLQQSYCNDYVLWWQHFINNSRLTSIQDYETAYQLTQTFYKNNTINQLLTLIVAQTNALTGPYAERFNQTIANKFTELNLVSHTAMRELRLTLHELTNFIKTLSGIHDQGKTAFALTKARFEGDQLANPLSALYINARQLPAPLSTWVKQLADDTSSILMNETRHYINQQWVNVVIPPYQQTIHHRYPLDAEQKQTIAITDFDRFFAAKGILNQFIETHIKPFLDTSQPQWQRKEVNHYVLPIATETINEFIRANVITNMFFQNQSDTSQIVFSLQKIDLDPVVAKLELSIGDTKLSDTQQSESMTAFHWPQSDAKLILYSVDGHHYELSEQGDWVIHND